MNKRLLLLVVFATTVSAVFSQYSYIPYKTYDGEHKNEVSGYMMLGNNVITDIFGGLAGSYSRHLSNRWQVGGDLQMQFGKRLYSIDVRGSYRLPVKYGNVYFSAKTLFNYYAKWGFTEWNFNLSAQWESAYVDFLLGESFIHYHSRSMGKGFGYSEPLTLTFGFGANIRHRDNPWNVGIFFRNFDDFYYENWNINWGLRWYAKINEPIRLFGEFNIRPAGSMSQLASKYEGSIKVGLRYKW